MYYHKLSFHERPNFARPDALLVTEVRLPCISERTRKSFVFTKFSLIILLCPVQLQGNLTLWKKGKIHVCTAKKLVMYSWKTCRQGIVATGKPKWQMHKASHYGNKQQQRSPDKITLLYIASSRHVCYYSYTSHLCWTTQSTQLRSCNKITWKTTSSTVWDQILALYLISKMHKTDQKLWSKLIKIFD